MQRRKFIQRTAWVTGGLLIAGKLPARVFTGNLQKIKGRITSGGRGLKAVVVSDGYSVVITDDNGRYQFDPHPDAIAIFFSTPAGYEFIQEKGITRHYKLISDINLKKDVNFELKAIGKDDNEHHFVIWADPQVKNEADVEKMMTESVPDVQKWVQAAGSSVLLHGITVGDIVWDELALFKDYDKAVSKMGIPFFQCLGNHDMDYDQGGDEASDNTFQQTYGPTYYSFNRGQAHYVVMDDVRYLGKGREYDGYISQAQLDWLKKDLSFVSKEKLIILCLHIPVHSGVKNNNDLYEILGERNVHIMSGHTHYQNNVLTGTIYEHNHGTVCGAWWTGPICGDGTPCGYGIYSVKGTELEWHYQSTGEKSDHQMKVFMTDMDASQKQVLVNIWNHDPEWKTECFVDDISNGALEQFEGFDPVAFKTMLGPDLPKPRGFAEPRKTGHLFKALIPSSAKEVKVVATDRFGRKFTETYKV